MIFGFFKKTDPVHSALVNGLNEMDKQGADRVILAIYESERDDDATGHWMSINRNYYPFEMLDEREQEMIRDGKHYMVVALVRDNVGNVAKYGDMGVEVAHRTHVFPLLPRLTTEAPFNYVTKSGVYTGEGLKKFAKTATSNGWNSQAIEQRVQAGIQEYHTITEKLMDNAGLYTALERMEEREYSPFKQIMKDMRSNIAAAEVNNN